MSMSIRAFFQRHGKALLSFTPALALLVSTGCSGINASHSFSPLDFLLPGLVENQSPNGAAAQPKNAATTNRVDLAFHTPAS